MKKAARPALINTEPALGFREKRCEYDVVRANFQWG
jgi:hypothetical protein